MAFKRLGLFSFFYLTLALCFLSCVAYTPQNAPPVLIEKKGDVEIGGGINGSFAIFSTSVSANIAYGLTDKIQTQLFGSFTPLTVFSPSPAYHLQGIAGYRFSINERVTITPFLGYFYGTSHQSSWGLSREKSLKQKVNYQSGFGQVQFALKRGEKFWGGSLKIGGFYSSQNISQYDLTTTENDWEYTLFRKDFVLLIEPSIFYSFPFGDGYKFYSSYSYSFLNIARYEDLAYNTPTGSLAIGLTYTFKRKNKN